jgi:hypothetical protein
MEYAGHAAKMRGAALPHALSTIHSRTHTDVAKPALLQATGPLSSSGSSLVLSTQLQAPPGPTVTPVQPTAFRMPPVRDKKRTRVSPSTIGRNTCIPGIWLTSACDLLHADVTQIPGVERCVEGRQLCSCAGPACCMTHLRRPS